MDKNYNRDLGFVRYVLQNKGSIHPLIVPASLTKGTGLMNPSVFIDNGKVLVNIRHVNYTLYHSEGKLFQHQFGPLQYLHPEDDRALRTENYICTLNNDLSLKSAQKVDTSALDVKPLWEFTGLEDARLFRWNDKLYLCGVRRDTTTNGQGRMELSEIEIDDTGAKEVSRFRIPAPPPDNSYCEKNWMPVLDMPYHLVKWSNPTEVVKVDKVAGTCNTAILDEKKFVPMGADMRGGSQVIPWGNNERLALVHEVNLFNSELGRKDGTYRHRIVVWDKDWNIVRYSPQFNFMTGEIEFCAGAAIRGDDLLISFGFQDNASYLLRTPIKLVNRLLGQ
jgi:hypothetical protein